MNVLITGSNRGIGLELVKQYREKGEEVFAVCRKPSEELEKTGAKVFSGIDVTQEKSVREFVENVPFSSLDLLVNVAGVFLNETLPNLNFDSIRTQFEVNALGPIRVTQAFLPFLKKGSKLAMITSRMGSIADNGSGGYYGYRMSKAALNIASVSLARDLGAQGVSVGIFHPGFVKTQMTDFQGNITPEESASGLIQLISRLSAENSGKFWHVNGEELPW